ncbi:MAG: cyclic nucleotide-binding domain-containing protein [Myxococcales bacterium]|nr:cyclic nucleotide-binding domain-containing protein [Myxococcales bacterium]
MQEGRKLIAWLEQQGYFEDALVECDKLLKETPDDSELSSLRASLLARCGRREEAIEAYADIAMGLAHRGQYLRAISCSKALALLDFAAYERLSRRLAAFYNERYAAPSEGLEAPAVSLDPSTSMSVAELSPSSLSLDEQESSSGEIPISWVEPTPQEPLRPQIEGDIPRGPETQEIDQVALEEFRRREATQQEAMQRLPDLFSRLDADSTAALMDYLFPVEAVDGQILMRQGERGNEFFLISEGRVVLTRRVDGEEEVLAELGPGQFFGEIALLTPLRRTATVTCLGPCQLLRLTREDLRGVVQAYPNVDIELRRFVYQRLVHNLLLTSFLFFPLPTAERVAFVEFFSVLEAKEGLIMLQEGQPSNALYLIAGGTVEFMKRKSTHEEVSFQTLGVGDFFGESAILGRGGMPYSIRLVEDCILLKLRFEDAVQVRSRFPKAIELLRNISEQRRREVGALSSMWSV